jgi:hypothetical protein
VIGKVIGERANRALDPVPIRERLLELRPVTLAGRESFKLVVAKRHGGILSPYDA